MSSLITESVNKILGKGNMMTQAQKYDSACLVREAGHLRMPARGNEAECSCKMPGIQ
jgi:hypothetical protein